MAGSVGHVQIFDDPIIFQKAVQFMVPPVIGPDPTGDFEFKWDAVNSRILARDAADAAYVDFAANKFILGGSSGALQVSGGNGNVTIAGWFGHEGMEFKDAAGSFTGVIIPSGSHYAWNNANNLSAPAEDLFLYRDAANTLAQRNGINAQKFNIYNTYTDASNYERFAIDWATTPNILSLQTANAGTGSARAITVAASAINLGINGAGIGWTVNASRHLVAGTDNSFDIGASAATRPRSIYVGTSFLAPNGLKTAPSIAFAGDLTTGAYWRAASTFSIALNNIESFNITTVGVQISASIGFGPISNDFSVTAADLFAVRDAANILAQRNGTTAQTFRIYNTFTDTNNYERVELSSNLVAANTFALLVNQLGTGSPRTFYVGTIGNSGLIFRTNNGDRWAVQATGHFTPQTDVTYDIGTASFFAKDLYYRRKITKIAVIAYSASMTPDASLGDMQQITITNGTAFTINAPTNPLTGQWLEIMIRNTSGGAAGVATWNAVFKMVAWTQPATANSRSITFRYDGTNWVETSRTTVDVPN